MDKFPLTKKGFLRLEQELKTLKGPMLSPPSPRRVRMAIYRKMPNTRQLKKNKALLKGGFRSWKPSSAGHKLLTRQK